MPNVAEILFQQEVINTWDEEAARNQSDKNDAHRTKQVNTVPRNRVQKMINSIINLSKTQETLHQNYETMTSQLEKENKLIRYVENEI